MDFKTAVITCLQKFIDFNGRASRSEYWWFFLAVFIASFVLAFIPFVGWIVSLALVVPGVAAAVRRMHDIGKSGWWILIGLIPLVGLIVLYWAVQPSARGANAWGDQPAHTIGT